MNRVDLLVVGSDFYSGSTRDKERLKDGWCDFKALGRNFAQEYFGTSRAIENVWYLATRVSREASRSFEEYRRQGIWLDALDPSVIRMIIDPAPAEPLSAASGQGELHCSTEGAAIAALRARPLAPQVLVISSGGEESTPLCSFLSERYGSDQIVLVPPDFAMRDDGRGYPVHLRHEDLEAARLAKEGLWGSYEESKRRADLAAKWAKSASADLGTWLTRRLRSVPFRSPDGWKKKAQADHSIRIDLEAKVARFLTTRPVEDKGFAKERTLAFFIAKRLVEEYANYVLAERTEVLGSQPRFLIRSGRDLVDQSPRAFPALEICEDAERQILELTGNERFFGWLVDGFSIANREMQNWLGGRFPHERLLNAARCESESVRNDAKFLDKRRFRARSGEWLLFESHMKNRSENKRVHYKVDPDRKLLMIGYVGDHLPTPLYST